MDITETLAPNSDQLDAVDLVHGARTFTITKVGKNASPDQPVNITLAEFPRVWRPGKSMRRVLAAGWGVDASAWVGRRVTLYCDPTVRFGGSEVGGTRISHMSDLPKGKALSVPLLVTRGKSAVFKVQPLTEAAPPAVEPNPLAGLVTAFDLAGITDNAARLTYCANLTKRDLTSAKDLTPDEIRTVIDALHQDAHDLRHDRDTAILDDHRDDYAPEAGEQE